jgi:uncharacterized protein YwqG
MPNLAPEQEAELNDAISEYGLQSVSSQILAHAKECYAMVPQGEDGYSSIGNTRLGGDPDLPQSCAWPTDPDDDDRFSNFIAQINFAELPALFAGNPLPTNGILYLFVRSMESAAQPVVLDSIFFDGEVSELARRPSPDEESLCDEQLVDLVPQRVRAVPSVSLPIHCKRFQKEIEEAHDVDELYEMQSYLARDKQIGQLLGYANAYDIQKNLYRQVVLAQLNKRRLIYNDYWDTMEEYDASIKQWQDNKQLAKSYIDMRDGVVWLTSNREMIDDAVAQWRLLFQLDSNPAMNLNINDADPLYVFIRDEDLASRNFRNIAGEVTQG